MSSLSVQTAPNRYMVRAGILLTSTVFCTGVIRSFYPVWAMLFIFLLSLEIGGWLIVELGYLIFCFRQLLWRRAISIIVIAGAVWFGLFPFWNAAYIAGDYIHLLMYYPIYKAEIRKHEGVPVTFSWGDGDFFGFSKRRLIYDPIGKGEVSVDDEFDGATYETRRLFDSFFVITYCA